eukprot:15353592-Ditylum_brightwellii.AAC.1
MVTGTTTVQQWTGWEVQSVECPDDICDYQDDMGTVDKGNQHRALSAAFLYNMVELSKGSGLSSGSFILLHVKN